MNIKVDDKERFISVFNEKTGSYFRSGVIKDDKIFETMKNTKNVGHLFLQSIMAGGKDPFMASYPELLDIGIMQTCVCSHKCNVDCYQKAVERSGANMSLENLEKILKESEGRLFQCALGGAGDVDTHENFEEVVKLCNQYRIVPNFTTSGIAMTKEKAEICKKYCGAVAVSEHFADYTDKALDLLLEAKVKTNIHYVLNNESIDIAIDRMKNNGFKKGINAVVFLLYKPIGLGKKEKMLTVGDSRLSEFFNLVNNKKFPYKIGFDSCSCAGIVNYTDKVNMNSIDFCEGGRFSAYIDANMHMMPCSFANQNPDWFIDLNTHSVEEAWNSEIFDKFRYSLAHSCPTCPNRDSCGGGCPLVNEITLCNKKERNFIRK